MSLLSFFTGGGFKTVESIAKEWIDTAKETAEAKVLMVKTLDPNGLMRREISTKITSLYVFYVLLMAGLIILEFFGIGDPTKAAVATTKLTELFLPITSMVGVILSASFGVNYTNTKSNK